jgi:hypothetical protein
MDSLLSIAVEKMVNEVREASRQSGGSSEQPLSIVEIIWKLIIPLGRRSNRMQRCCAWDHWNSISSTALRSVAPPD